MKRFPRGVEENRSRALKKTKKKGKSNANGLPERFYCNVGKPLTSISRVSPTGYRVYCFTLPTWQFSCSNFFIFDPSVRKLFLNARLTESEYRALCFFSRHFEINEVLNFSTIAVQAWCIWRCSLFIYPLTVKF